MPGFVAEGVVERLDYDFRPYVNASGTIPEPTDKRIELFLKGIKQLYTDAKAATPAIEADASPAGLINALDMLDPEATVKVMTGMSEVYAELCGGTPTVDEINQLPMRVRTVFFAWLQGEVMAPEAVTPGGNGQVRALPTARGA
jgi:hypothetical protein